MRSAMLFLALIVIACAGESPPPGGFINPRIAPLTGAAPSPALHVDGPPPVIAHEDYGAACVKCHTLEGRTVPGMGAISPLPHTDARTLDRCVMCHVYAVVEGTFRESAFVRPDFAPLTGTAGELDPPPTIPHRLVLRANCTACHAGEGADEAIRTDHPERERCTQCHVPVRSTGEFGR